MLTFNQDMELHVLIYILCFGILWNYDCVEGTDVLRENSIRLVGATTESAGRVEIYHDGIWGTVCDDGWGYYDAEVVCDQLGFPGAYAAVNYAYYGQGTGPIMLDDVNCNGWEHYLAECRHDGWYDHNCDHSEDAGVQCTIPGVHYPRLINGYTYYEGRVEIWNGFQWTKLCSESGFDENEADTICKQLGHGPLDYMLANDEFGEGSSSASSWGYTCYEEDDDLWQCDRYSYTGSTCTPVAFRCTNEVSLTGWTIAGICIGVTAFVGFCLFSCVAVYKQSKARKSRRRNTPDVAYVGGASNPAGPTVQYVTSPANQMPPNYNQVVSNTVYYPPVPFNQQQPPQYGPGTPANNLAYPPPSNTSNGQQPNT